MSTDPDRDPALAAVWREHSTETPPAPVDAAILAAAHRAAASAPHGRERWLGPRAWRWWMPLAAAAVVAVVIVGVKPPGQTLQDDAAQTASDVAAESAQSDASARQSGRTGATEAIAARPTPKLEPERAQTFAAPAPTDAARMLMAPGKPALPAARVEAGSALSADDWIARIRASRERGAQDEALRELAGFRAAYADADARLPADLREWAERLPR